MSRRVRLPSPADDHQLGEAIARAVAFLEARQLPDGQLRVLTSKSRAMERDCREDPSVFPTALIVDALAETPEAKGLCARAAAFLEREMDRHGVWRHWTRSHPRRGEIPPDLDDTSVASSALLRVGREVPDNRDLLLENRDRRGLFQTWLTVRPNWPRSLRHLSVASGRLRRPFAFHFFRRTSASPFDVDAVVNANVLAYLGRGEHAGPVVAHLLQVLHEERESECDKWYENPFVVWYFFTRALRDIAPEASGILVRRVERSKRMTALDAALAATTLLWWGRSVDMEPLLAAQQETGAWARAGMYHGGRARRRDGSFAPPHPDAPWWGSEELTTALAVQALSLARAVQRS